MTACYYSVYCDLIHNGDATTQNNVTCELRMYVSSLRKLEWDQILLNMWSCPYPRREDV
jgi:hypothetical protein